MAYNVYLDNYMSNIISDYYYECKLHNYLKTELHKPNQKRIFREVFVKIDKLSSTQIHKLYCLRKLILNELNLCTLKRGWVFGNAKYSVLFRFTSLFGSDMILVEDYVINHDSGYAFREQEYILSNFRTELPKNRKRKRNNIMPSRKLTCDFTIVNTRGSNPVKLQNRYV